MREVSLIDFCCECSDLTRLLSLLHYHLEASEEFAACFLARFPELSDAVELEGVFLASGGPSILIKPSPALLSFVQDLI